MTYPTLEQAKEADRFTLCKMWRFLRPPETDGQRKVYQAMSKRFHEAGGFTTEISKRLGWEDIY